MNWEEAQDKLAEAREDIKQYPPTLPDRYVAGVCNVPSETFLDCDDDAIPYNPDGWHIEIGWYKLYRGEELGQVGTIFPYSKRVLPFLLKSLEEHCGRVLEEIRRDS